MGAGSQGPAPKPFLAFSLCPRMVFSYTSTGRYPGYMPPTDGAERSKRRENVHPDVINGGFVFKPDITGLGRKSGFVHEILSSDGPCQLVD